MNSKQLANVLIKILGLSIFINGGLGFFTGLLQLCQIGFSGRSLPVAGALYTLAHATVSLAIGIYLTLKSRQVAGFLFKGEAE
jgi:hypothetical protein